MKHHNTLESIIARSIPVTESGCWLWLGSTKAKGYGNVNFNGKAWKVHRIVYELMRGPIPTGFTIDHLCRVRCCINPDHLEPVTNKVNVLRGMGITAVNAKKTVCPYGHPYVEENIYRNIYNERECLTCKRARDIGRHRP